MCAWSFAGQALSAGIGALFANHSALKQYQYQSALQKQAAKLNYEYGIKSLENSPNAQRSGLESAGYNPMLAVQNATSGANSGWTSSGQATAPDYSQAMSNAFEFKRLQNESAQTESTVKLNEASGRKLVSEAVGQELKNPYVTKQEEAQLGRISAETAKIVRETDFIDALEQFKEKELKLQEMGINMDYSSRIYSANKGFQGTVYNSDTMKSIADKHSPSSRSQSFNNYMSGIHHGLSGVGELLPYKFGRKGFDMPDFDETQRTVTDKNQVYIKRSRRHHKK